MADAFDKSPAFARCAPYNYNYNKSMTENAKRLAAEIKDVAAPVVLAPDNGADRSRFPAARDSGIDEGHQTLRRALPQAWWLARG